MISAKHILLYLAATLLPLCAFATDTPHGKQLTNFALHLNANAQTVFPTNHFLRHTSGNDAVIAPDLRASFAFSPSTAYGRLFPNVRQGIGISPNFFLPKSAFGTPVSFYLFQSVRFAGKNALWFEGEWMFGVAAPWKKYDPDAPIVNNAIGSKANAMLAVGISANYRLSPHFALRASLNAFHYSNGNTHLPNAGVNTAGLSLGGIYYFSPDQSVFPLPTPQITFRRHFALDFTAYGATRRRVAVDGMGDIIPVRGSFGVAGLNIAPMYALNRYFRTGLSFDFQYDESANLAPHRVGGSFGDNLCFYRQPFADCFAVGLSLRAELTLPVFSVNVGLGRNIIANGPDTRIFYQTLALKAHIFKGTYLQVGYQLSNFHLPNNLMLGAGYTLPLN